MKTIVARVLFVAAYALRHYEIPSRAYTDLIVEQTRYEPLRNMPANAWSWAEIDQLV